MAWCFTYKRKIRIIIGEREKDYAKYYRYNTRGIAKSNGNYI